MSEKGRQSMQQLQQMRERLDEMGRAQQAGVLPPTSQFMADHNPYMAQKREQDLAALRKAEREQARQEAAAEQARQQAWGERQAYEAGRANGRTETTSGNSNGGHTPPSHPTHPSVYSLPSQPTYHASAPGAGQDPQWASVVQQVSSAVTNGDRGALKAAYTQLEHMSVDGKVQLPNSAATYATGIPAQNGSSLVFTFTGGNMSPKEVMHAMLGKITSVAVPDYGFNAAMAKAVVDIELAPSAPLKRPVAVPHAAPAATAQEPGTLLDWLKREKIGLDQMPQLNVAGGDFEMKPSEWRKAKANADEILAYAKGKGVDITQFSDVKRIAALDGDRVMSRDELTAYVIGLDVSANAHREMTSLGERGFAEVTDKFSMRHANMDVALKMAKEAFGDNQPSYSVADTSRNTDYASAIKQTPLTADNSRGPDGSKVRSVN